jgi:type II secretory pathway pseudopilin PulG
MVEIMVAVAILTIVVAGVMDSFVAQNRAYTVVDQTTETQQNIRAVGQLLEQDVRMSGFMVPEGAVACGVDAQNGVAIAGLLPGSDVLYVTDPDPVDPTDQAQADLGSNISAGYAPAMATLSLSDLSVDGRPYYDTNGDGAADSDFREGGGVIVMDTSNPARGTACGIVESVNTGAKHLRVDFEAGFPNPPPGTPLIAVPAHRYAVNDQNNLLRDGVSVVTDVDDLQLAYFMDADDDGAEDANEYKGDAAGNDYLSRGTNHSDLRELRFNLVLRSRMEDENFADGFMQATENRPAAGANDGYRRRVFTAAVKPRNVGFRGTAN